MYWAPPINQALCVAESEQNEKVPLLCSCCCWSVGFLFRFLIIPVKQESQQQKQSMEEEDWEFQEKGNNSDPGVYERDWTRNMTVNWQATWDLWSQI